MILLLFLNLYLFLIKADQSIIESDFHNNKLINYDFLI